MTTACLHAPLDRTSAWSHFRPEKCSSDQDETAQCSMAEDFFSLCGGGFSVFRKMVTLQRKRSARSAEAPAPVDIRALKAAAKEIIDCDDVLSLFAEDLKHVVAGEQKNAKIIFLAGTSRLLQEPMNIAIKGPSGSGKSSLRQRVKKNFFPPESVISFTALSEKALLFMREGFEHKILPMEEASATEEQAFQNYLLRSLMSEHKLVYQVTQKDEHGQLVTMAIEKSGPVSFMVTTTKNKLDPENETRLLSLEIDDSPEQTRAGLRKIAAVRGLNAASGFDAKYLEPWHQYQRWLAAGERRVFVPFLPVLSNMVPNSAVRLRRDFGQVITAIEAHALLHREYRNLSTKGSIVATIEEDYAVVRELLGDLLAETSETKVRKTVAETVAAVVAVDDEANEPDSDKEGGATVSAVAKELKLDKSTARRWLNAARDAELVKNIETRRGQPARYRATGVLVQKDISVLPTADDLREAYDDYRRKRAAVAKPKEEASLGATATASNGRAG
jgi:DNA-binding transcriptional ArsR family regulator